LRQRRLVDRGSLGDIAVRFFEWKRSLVRYSFVFHLGREFIVLYTILSTGRLMVACSVRQVFNQSFKFNEALSVSLLSEARSILPSRAYKALSCGGVATPIMAGFLPVAT
jgi:hypothetical protein